MVWKEASVMDERSRFCLEFERGHVSMTELCRVFGISRPTGYKWLGRFEAGGVAALADRSRARRTQPHAYPASVRALVIQSRKRHPTWGAAKLRVVLARSHPDLQLPSVTTMETILRDARLTRPRRRRSRRLHGAFGEPGCDDRPNGVWAVDYKGQFRLGDGSYCYPLTVTDSASRYLLGCVALTSTRYAPARQAFERLFAEYGVPEKIRSDNGSPFASTGVARLSRLSVYWMTLGIDPHRIRPGKPQDNGRHERMHRTLKAETTRPPATTRPGQQRRFNRFRREYNEVRPHEGLGMQCPADVYEPSTAAAMPRLYVYPGHWEQRLVSMNGQISWKKTLVFISESLAGQQVGLVEVDDGIWKVCFRHITLGRLNTRNKRPAFEMLRSRGRS